MAVFEVQVIVPVLTIPARLMARLQFLVLVIEVRVLGGKLHLPRVSLPD